MASIAEHDAANDASPDPFARWPRPFYVGPFRTTWRILGDRRNVLTAGIALRFVQSMFMAMPVGALVKAIDEIRQDSLTAGDAWVIVAIIAVSFVGQYLTAYGSNSLAWTSTFLAIGESRLHTLEHVLRVPLGVVMDRRQGDVTNVVASDYDQVSSFAHHSMPTLIGGVALPIAVSIVLLVVDPLLGLAVAVSIVAAVPVFLGINAYCSRTSCCSRER